MTSSPLILQGTQITAPPERRWVVVSSAVAVLLVLLPWGADIRPWLPDWLLMLLISWSLRDPRLLGVGGAFAAGLMLDLVHGTLLGVHAMAYSSAIFLLLNLQRRIEGFDWRGRALHVGPILILAALLPLLLSGMLGDAVTDWRPLAAGVIAALLWAPLDAWLGYWVVAQQGVAKESVR